MKAQIEADKKARAEKAAREKALREGKPLPGTEPAASSSSAPAVSAAPKTAGRDYPETRLQIRMASGGQPYTTTLPSDSSELFRCALVIVHTLVVHAVTGEMLIAVVASHSPPRGGGVPCGPNARG